MSPSRWIVLPLLALAGCQRPAPPPAAPGAAVEVDVFRLAPAADSDWYEATGRVHAVRHAELATRLMGTVESVRVRAGDRVRQGDLLLTLDAGAPRAGLAQARAAQELAALTLRRMERLFADSAIPAAQLDAARAAQAQAAGQQRAAEIEVGYGGLRAPFAGTITARLADPGDLAAPGKPLLVLEAGGEREIVAGIPEDLVAAIRPGLEVPVRIGALETPWRARVIATVPAVDPATHTAEVRLAAPAGLTSGTAVVVRFPLAARAVLRVPASALLRRSQLVGVLLLTPDSTLRLRWIRTGRIDAAGADVLAGLAPGDLIVARPDSLSDGTRARPRERPAAP